MTNEQIAYLAGVFLGFGFGLSVMYAALLIAGVCS